MKNTIKTILFLALLSTSIMNAQSDSKNKIKGNGNVISETRTTKSYDEIQVSGFFDVVLVSGTEGEITINGEENLLPYIKIEVENNALKIFTDKKSNISCSKGKTILITVPFEVISKIALSGSGDLKTKNTIKSDQFSAKLSGSGDLTLDLMASNFEFSLSGSGDVNLTGSSNDFISKMSGSGDIDASNLKSKNADIAISGSGDVKVFCSESLKARVSGSGDIIYKGDPKSVDKKVSGSGEISKG